MKTTIIATVVGIALSMLAATAFGAEGKIVKKDDLPASIKAQTGKVAKHNDSIPGCAFGRLSTEWGNIAKADGIEKVDAENHPCFAEKTIYVCRSFGLLSIRCENPK